jgi:hypothetical protein
MVGQVVGHVSLSLRRRRDAACDDFRKQHAACGPSMRAPHTIPPPVAPMAGTP